MTYGEYICGVANNEKNMLFINVTWGLGMGMIVDGKLSYGKSGFSGEIGHFPLLNNNCICHCGKMGCLETGASGSAGVFGVVCSVSVFSGISGVFGASPLHATIVSATLKSNKTFFILLDFS